MSVETVFARLNEMSVLELSELKTAIETEWGVSAQQRPAIDMVLDTEDLSLNPQTEFTVHLRNAGQQRIAVIKAVREVLLLGLKEAKDLVDQTPVAVAAAVDREAADKIRDALTDAGAEVEIV